MSVLGGRDAAHYLLRHYDELRCAHRWRARIGEYTVPTNERGNLIELPEINGMEAPFARKKVVSGNGGTPVREYSFVVNNAEQS